ncbi:MAG: DNA translocase FtsK [Rhodobiaceae bacterium]|nr:DNA translocase FtsK [Rhodobiaceae bacterium]
MRVTRPINDAPLIDASAFRGDETFLDRVAKRLRAMVRYIAGAAIFAGVVAFIAALATWSVDDPSLNHATRSAAQNLLGLPGAILADLSMQVFGLAAFWIAAPFAAFALRLVRHQGIGTPVWRAAACLGGIVSAAAAAAVFPAPQTWPLPVGLGGFVGEAIVAMPRFVLSSFIGSLARVPLVAVFAAAAIAGIGWGSGLLWTRHDRGATNVSKTDEDFADDDETDGDASEGGYGLIGLGVLLHWAISLKSWLMRIRTRRKPKVLSVRSLFGEFADEPVPTAGGGRIEPGFAHSQPAPATAHPYAAQADADIYAPPSASRRELDDYDADYGDDYGEDIGSAPPASARVQSMRGELKQGRRARMEAQPSLLPNDFYELPPLNLLGEPPKVAKTKLSADALEQNARLLEGVLDDFGVRGEILNVHPGPVVTLYELEPAPGTKSSRVIGLADDIARSMSAIAARVAVVPGRNAIGIELPNSQRETVFLRELLASEDFEKNKAKLPLCLGKTIGGEPVIADLARMPHLLIAGTTGSGKSVAINTMILSLLYRLNPERCKLIMIDPKMLELSVYDGIPHLLAPVVTDPKKAVVALKWTVREMEDRYRKMSKLGVRNIDGFNARVAAAAKSGETITRTVQTGFDPETGEAIYEHEEMALEPMPYLVVIVDEMADLMMVAGKDIEGAVQRLAQMARAAGIHIITATQRPSVDVITGTIKANFPTRISFQVTSKIDSRTILGEQGAEQLLGQGDMLFMEGGGRITRAHGPFVTDDEVEKIVAHLKAQGRPDYLEEITEESEEDPIGGAEAIDAGGEAGDLYDQAVAVVLRDKKASTSYIQRRLSIGYNRAATLIERMEEEGVISRPNAKGHREILVGGGAEDV